MATTTEQIDALTTKAMHQPEERQKEIVAALREMLDEHYSLSLAESEVLQPALAEAQAGEHLSDAETDNLLNKPWS